jgi:hypothetical protein
MAKYSTSFYSKLATANEANTREEFIELYPLVATSFALQPILKSDFGNHCNGKG